MDKNLNQFQQLSDEELTNVTGGVALMQTYSENINQYDGPTLWERQLQPYL